jgi:hypothetical protein
MTFGLRRNVRATSPGSESEHASRLDEVEITLTRPALHDACKIIKSFYQHAFENQPATAPNSCQNAALIYYMNSS